MNQINRIEEFISSIENGEIRDDSQSFVLNGELSSIAGDNGWKCPNSTPNGCSGTNRKCVNTQGACGASDNKGRCSNSDSTTTSPTSTCI